MHFSRIVTVPAIVLWFGLVGRSLLALLFGWPMTFEMSDDPPMETIVAGVLLTLTIGVLVLHYEAISELKRVWFEEACLVLALFGVVGSVVGYLLWLMSEPAGANGHFFYLGMLALCGLILLGFRTGVLHVSGKGR